MSTLEEKAGELDRLKGHIVLAINEENCARERHHACRKHLDDLLEKERQLQSAIADLNHLDEH